VDAARGGDVGRTTMRDKSHLGTSAAMTAIPLPWSYSAAGSARVIQWFT